ncbi:MAG: Bax inhibitor-1/YccA family protein [Crocinitomicaceae bacterium]|jgi:FtsH-binding integral membrane protein|nr:Bax inhibitor-1/YccA family protein [Crocinitomicaceae bacterium]
MEDLNYQNSGSLSQDYARDFIKSVYNYMFAALTITGVISYIIGTNTELMSSLFMTASGGVSMFFYVVLFSPILISFAMAGGFNKFSFGTLMALFVIYSVLLGMSLSILFMKYSTGTLATTFLLTAGSFGFMAFLGYTTKTDLTKFGSLLYMLLFGVIISSVVNMFLGSSGFDYIISLVSVFIFTGLVAYEMQMIKNMAHQAQMDGTLRQKLALFAGFQLYLTFVNLFLSLLRLLGNRD